MEQQWYYAAGNQQQGPVDAAAIRELIGSGRMGPNDLVWKDGMADWVPASTIPEFVIAPAAAPPPAVPPGASVAQPGYPAPEQMPPNAPYTPNYMSGDPAMQQMQSKATTAMTVGIISLVLSACVCGPAGLALGIWAWTSGNKIPPGYAFSGQAKTGVICGIIGTILGAISTIFQLLWMIGMMASSF